MRRTRREEAARVVADRNKEQSVVVAEGRRS